GARYRKRVTVRRRLRHPERADRPAGAGDVLDHHLLAQRLRHRHRDQARDRIGRAARLKRRDDGDEARGKILRRCARGTSEQRRGKIERRPEHEVLPFLPAYTSSTGTWHVGFLFQAELSAARTARRTASATASGSRRRARGIDSKASTAASYASSSGPRPSVPASGIPISLTCRSPIKSPRPFTASATETMPAKPSRRRSSTVRSSALTISEPSL